MSNRGLAQDMTPVLQASLMLSAHEQGGKKVPHAGEHTWGPLGGTDEGWRSCSSAGWGLSHRIVMWLLS